MTGIARRVNNPPWQHGAAGGAQPALDICLFWVGLAYLAMLEGCQISIVGLQGYDPEAFKDTHPRAYRSCKLLTGANVERFLVGRQFLLLFTGFLVSRIGGGANAVAVAAMPATAMAAARAPRARGSARSIPATRGSPRIQA